MWAPILSIGVILMFNLTLVSGNQNSTKGNKTTFHSFLIGGKKAKPGQFPSAVSLRYEDGEHFCGGTIISEEWVVTASHCVELFFKNPKFRKSKKKGVYPLYVMAGENIMLPLDRVKSLNHVTKIIQYNPKFKFPYEDIALIRVKREFDLDDRYIEAATLTRRRVKPNQKCEISGWGHTKRDDGSKPSSYLLYFSLPIIQISEKKDIIYGGDEEGEEHTCRGDSGSGLICKGELTAIVAGSKDCTAPTAYNSVLYYSSWIKKKAGLTSTRQMSGGSRASNRELWNPIFLMFLTYLIFYTY